MKAYIRTCVALMRTFRFSALFSFNGGFVDTAGFLGLQGLFTAHVTGNFVTIASALVLGTHGVFAKLLALPEFLLVIGLARLGGSALRAAGLPALPILLRVKVCFLLFFFVLAVAFGPFPDSDAPGALLTAFAGIAIQNAVQRVHFASIPATTLMTGNTIQTVLDAVDLIRVVQPDNAPEVRARFVRTLRGIIWFAGGCAVAALMYYWIGFWCLALPVVVGAATAVLHKQD